MTRPSFRCPDCNKVSYHPDDVAEGYCANCRAFTRVTAPDPGPVIIHAEIIGPRAWPARHHSSWYVEPKKVEGEAVVTAMRPCLQCGKQVLCNFDVEANEARGVPASCAEHD